MAPKVYVKVSPTTLCQLEESPATFTKSYSQTISPRQTSAEMMRKTSDTITCFCCCRASRIPILRATKVYAKANSTHSTAYCASEVDPSKARSRTYHNSLARDTHGGAYANSTGESGTMEDQSQLRRHVDIGLRGTEHGRACPAHTTTPAKRHGGGPSRAARHPL